jgi:aminopeptidase N
LPVAEDRPLAEFTARYHGASQIVGYNKAAMLFLMLRDRIGREAFDAGLRRFWREHRFKVASWSDLRRAFEVESGVSLEAFFAQWLTRAGAPDLRIAGAEAAPSGNGYRVRVTLEQGTPAYRLRVPLVVRTAGGDAARTVDIENARQTVSVDVERAPLADVRLFRRLGPDEAPPILRGLMVDPATTLVVVSPVLEAGAKSLAARLLDHPSRALAADAAPIASPLLVVGLRSDVDAWLARTGLGSRPAPAERGDAQVWMARRDKAGPVGVVSVSDTEALAALERPLPHYGRVSWLVLEGGRIAARGTYSSEPQVFPLDRTALHPSQR